MKKISHDHLVQKVTSDKPKMKLGKLNQHPDVVDKHRECLSGTGFEDCAPCPGCPGKLYNGRMRCSNAGPEGVFVTSEQSKVCKGDKPFCAETASATRHALPVRYPEQQAATS